MFSGKREGNAEDASIPQSGDWHFVRFRAGLLTRHGAASGARRAKRFLQSARRGKRLLSDSGFHAAETGRLEEKSRPRQAVRTLRGRFRGKIRRQGNRLAQIGKFLSAGRKVFRQRKIGETGAEMIPWRSSAVCFLRNVVSDGPFRPSLSCGKTPGN